jgi:diaminopimelate decarboxylase
MKEKYNLSDFLQYKEGNLYIDNICYTKLLEKTDTPLVCISLKRIRRNIQIIKQALENGKINYQIYYALKASYFRPSVLSIRNENVGAEVISGYELKLALLAGFKKKSIIFNGLGRKGVEIHEALKQGIVVNVDSLSELKSLGKLKKSNCEMKIGLRIHPIFKGDGNFVKRNGKLGMNYSEALECIKYAAAVGLKISGFSYHIFSNQMSGNDYTRPLEHLALFIKKAKNDAVKLEYIDIGGGIAPRMFFEKDKSVFDFINKVSEIFSKNYSSDITLVIEPGRYIVADSVVILSQIKAIKKNKTGKWAILDIGTNYLIPALGSNFKIITCKKKRGSNLECVKFVDRICSPAGFIGSAFADVNEGDVVAVINCGAYTSVMKEEFVFGSPRHIFIDNSKIINTIKAVSFNDFSKYHGWK